jgi:beta-lactamase superfamily II metal-dependent hydrolase
MSTVKSFSVGNGDMFYINHFTKSFTVIDCCLDKNRVHNISEITALANTKEIVRFISTHPDDDHIAGLKNLDDVLTLINFYCVQNQATKAKGTDDFKRYCELRDSEKKAFYLYCGCKRKWLNQGDEVRGGSGINVYWPDRENASFIAALETAKEGDSANNISPIFTYSVEGGVTMMWMGDLETSFMEEIGEVIELPKANILFAAHHGRQSGTVPQVLLDKINPDIIVIGEAPSDDLNYYPDHYVITQNSAGDITFICDGKKVHIFVSEEDYSVDFLDDERQTGPDIYLGTLNL